MKRRNKSLDYVFRDKDGKLEYVGDFDGLYKNEEDPWGQCSDIYYNRRNNVIIDTLEELEPRSVLDVGCGLGQVTQLIDIMVTKDVKGVDISPEAIKRARELFPTVTFDVMDIRKDRIYEKYDVILMSGILWYILNDLDAVLKKVRDALEYEGYIVIFQTFIPDQKYGKDIVDGYEGWFSYLKKLEGLRIIKSKYYDTLDDRKDSIVVLKSAWNNEADQDSD